MLIDMEFNSREIATFVWLVIGLTYFLLKIDLKKFGKSIYNLLNAFFQDKIITLFLISIIYTELLVLFLALTKFWDLSNIKETIVWFFGTGFIFIFNISKLSNDFLYFKKIIFKIFKYTIFLEFIVNLYSFSFSIEFFLVPFIFVIIMLDYGAEIDDKNEIIKKFTKPAMSVVGFILFFYFIYRFVLNLDNFLWKQNIKDFILPLILSLFFIPFLYVVAVVSKYETVFLRLKWLLYEKGEYRMMKPKIIRLCKLNLNKLILLSEQRSFKIIREYKDFEVALNEFKQNSKNKIQC